MDPSFLFLAIYYHGPPPPAVLVTWIFLEPLLSRWQPANFFLKEDAQAYRH